MSFLAKLSFNYLTKGLDAYTKETIAGLLEGKLRVHPNHIPRNLEELAQLDAEYAKYM